MRRVHDLTTRLAMEVAPEKAQLKARAARAGRHVRVRLAADGMADLVVHLPAEQAAACFGALHRAVHEHYVTAESVTRCRGQILADTLVERLTGQATARDVAVEVQILMPVEALLDPTSAVPAQIAGHGPIPVQIARELLATTARKKNVPPPGDSRRHRDRRRLPTPGIRRSPRDASSVPETVIGAPNRIATHRYGTSTTSSAGPMAAAPNS